MLVCCFFSLQPWIFKERSFIVISESGGSVSPVFTLCLASFLLSLLGPQNTVEWTRVVDIVVSLLSAASHVSLLCITVEGPQ